MRKSENLTEMLGMKLTFKERVTAGDTINKKK